MIINTFCTTDVCIRAYIFSRFVMFDSLFVGEIISRMFFSVSPDLKGFNSGKTNKQTKKSLTKLGIAV